MRHLHSVRGANFVACWVPTNFVYVMQELPLDRFDKSTSSLPEGWKFASLCSVTPSSWQSGSGINDNKEEVKKKKKISFGSYIALRSFPLGCLEGGEGVERVRRRMVLLPILTWPTFLFTLFWLMMIHPLPNPLLFIYMLIFGTQCILQCSHMLTVLSDIDCSSHIQDIDHAHNFDFVKEFTWYFI